MALLDFCAKMAVCMAKIAQKGKYQKKGSDMEKIAQNQSECV